MRSERVRGRDNSKNGPFGIMSLLSNDKKADANSSNIKSSMGSGGYSLQSDDGTVDRKKLAEAVKKMAYQYQRW